MENTEIFPLTDAFSILVIMRVIYNLYNSKLKLLYVYVTCIQLICK